MKPGDRIVTHLPLAELWNQEGSTIDAVRIGDLDREKIRRLLRLGALRFVIADVGFPLEWIVASHCFTVWKSEVRQHLHGTNLPYFDDYPDGYQYFASEWHLDSREREVVLEKAH